MKISKDGCLVAIRSRSDIETLIIFDFRKFLDGLNMGYTSSIEADAEGPVRSTLIYNKKEVLEKLKRFRKKKLI